MFDHWTQHDWIGIATIIAPFLVAIIAHALLTARKLGKFEANWTTLNERVSTIDKDLEDRPKLKQQFEDMRDNVGKLAAKVETFARMDTSIQLLMQSTTTLASAVDNFQKESREARVETRLSIESIKADFKSEMRDLRHDVNNIMTGKVKPASRRGSREAS